MSRMAELHKCTRCKCVFDPYEHNQINNVWCPFCFCKNTEFDLWEEIDEELTDEERVIASAFVEHIREIRNGEKT